MLYIIAILQIIIVGILVYCFFFKKSKSLEEMSLLQNILNSAQNSQTNLLQNLRTDIFTIIQNNNNALNQQLTQLIQSQANNTAGIKDSIMDQFEKIITSNSDYQEKIIIALQNSLKDIQEANEAQLNKIQNTVDEKLDKTLNTRLNDSFEKVTNTLNELYKSLGEIDKLSSSVGDLNKTLSNVKTRGTWGEIQLEAILEQTMTPAQYDTNVVTKKNSNDRIEFAIKIPSKENDKTFIYLPIDSKMPTDIYNKIVTASQDADVKALQSATKELEQRIKSEARTIRDKYIDPPNTTDFAVMFLPTEGLYAEALRINGLMEWCQTQCRIIISGPSTITALLNSLRVGFSNMALNKKSQDVLKLLQAIKTQYVTFNELIEKTQKKLHDAVSSTDNLKQRTDMIQRKLNKIEELDENESNEILSLTTISDDDY